MIWIPFCLSENIFVFETGINTLRPRQNRRHVADDIFKCILLNKIVWIPIKISLKFVFKSAINNIPAMVQIMAWRRPGDKPLSEPTVVSLSTHICVARSQWVSYTARDYVYKVRIHIKYLTLVVPHSSRWWTQCAWDCFNMVRHNRFKNTKCLTQFLGLIWAFNDLRLYKCKDAGSIPI